MKRGLQLLVGVSLILMGGLALAFNIILPWLGWDLWLWGGWRLWPLGVLCLGMVFLLLPLLTPGRRGLAGLFIPGVPILVTGAILLFASLFDRWGAWEWLWPLEVIALGLGFLLAAVRLRAIWLLLPAIVIGVNGLMFQFCAVTGLWDLWAVLWAFEPLSVGLAFLLINVKQRSPGLFVAGLVLCGLGAMGLIGMTALFPGWLLFSALGSITLVLVGVLTLTHSLLRRPVPQELPAE